MIFKDWLTISQIAKRLNKSRAWIHRLRERGNFPSAIQVANQYFIHRQDLDNYLNPNNNLEALIQCHACGKTYRLKNLYAVENGGLACIPCYRQHFVQKELC